MPYMDTTGRRSGGRMDKGTTESESNNQATSRTIYKYQLNSLSFLANGIVNFQMPVQRRYLTVQMQGDIPTLWVEVDTRSGFEEVSIAIVGTGNPMPENYHAYLGTVQEGPMVWHYFAK